MSPKHEQIDFEFHEFGYQYWDMFGFFLGVAKLKRYVFAFDITEVSQSLAKAFQLRAGSLGSPSVETNPIRGTLFGSCASADQQFAKSNALSAKQEMLSRVLTVYS